MVASWVRYQGTHDSETGGWQKRIIIRAAPQAPARWYFPYANILLVIWHFCRYIKLRPAILGAADCI